MRLRKPSGALSELASTEEGATRCGWAGDGDAMAGMGKMEKGRCAKVQAVVQATRKEPMPSQNPFLVARARANAAIPLQPFPQHTPTRTHDRTCQPMSDTLLP